jgi:hypothetical protein
MDIAHNKCMTMVSWVPVRQERQVVHTPFKMHDS